MQNLIVINGQLELHHVAVACAFRQGGQHALYPFGIADVDQQQGQDHQGEGCHLQHLGGDAGQERL